MTRRDGVTPRHLPSSSPHSLLTSLPPRHLTPSSSPLTHPLLEEGWGDEEGWGHLIPPDVTPSLLVRSRGDEDPSSSPHLASLLVTPSLLVTTPSLER